MLVLEATITTYEQGKSKVNNLIYPVPNPGLHFRCYFTRMVDGSIEWAPMLFLHSNVKAMAKRLNLKDTFEALMYKGTWKLFLIIGDLP